MRPGRSGTNWPIKAYEFLLRLIAGLEMRLIWDSALYSSAWSFPSDVGGTHWRLLASALVFICLVSALARLWRELFNFDLIALVLPWSIFKINYASCMRQVSKGQNCTGPLPRWVSRSRISSATIAYLCLTQILRWLVSFKLIAPATDLSLCGPLSMGTGQACWTEPWPLSEKPWFPSFCQVNEQGLQRLLI